MLSVGDKAPEFALPSDGDDTVRLADFLGQKVVLYFYPKDNTAGCTIEACQFRDHMPEFEDRGAVVLGVSPDTVRSHEKFKGRYGLPFTLLSDPDHAVAEAYGAWGAKKRAGKTTEGMHRTTFVIDEEGKIERVFQKVKPDGHAEEVLSSLTE